MQIRVVGGGASTPTSLLHSRQRANKGGYPRWDTKHPPPLRRRPLVVVVKPNCHTASTSLSAMPPPWSDSLQTVRGR